VTSPGPDLDPVIHVPARLRIMVALASLPPSDTLSFSRLQRLLGLRALLDQVAPPPDRG
jgi:hypothetical protein